MNKFNYKTANMSELANHMVDETKAIMTDKALVKTTDFDHYEIVRRNVTCRCLVGHMAHRSGVQIVNKEGYLTDEFLEIFGTEGIYSRRFGRYRRDQVVAGRDDIECEPKNFVEYRHRLKSAELMLDDLPIV